MIWKTTGAYFRLTLLGYRDADPQGDALDDNWLLVRVDAAGPGGAWSVVDPCLTTHEVAALADWLAAQDRDPAAQSAAPRPAISFLEPMLLFRRVEIEDRPAVSVYFGGLVYPNWDPQEMTIPRENLSLAFPINEIDPRTSARDLKAQLSRFPVRGQ